MGATSVIRGNLLELFGNDAASGKAKVIVEAKRPAAALPRTAGAGLRTSPRELLPTARRPARAPDASAAPETMQEVEAALKELGVGRARRNELSGSFVVELTREQLESLSRNPAVQAIRADTLRRKLS